MCRGRGGGGWGEWAVPDRENSQYKNPGVEVCLSCLRNR